MRSLAFRRSAATTRARVLAAALAALALVIGQPGLSRASAPNPDDIDVFALSSDGTYMAEWNHVTNQWIDLGGPKATDLVTGDAGVFDYNGNTGDIYEYDGTPGKWSAIGGPGNQFVEGGYHLYGTAPSGDYTAEWNGPGKGWTEIAGPTGEIWAGKAGLVRVNPTSNYAYLYDGTPGQWTYIGIGYAQFAVTDNAIYRLGADDGTPTVEQWIGPGDNWERIGGPCDEIYGGGAGLFCMAENPTDNVVADNIREYDGTPNSWTQIGGPGALFAVSGSYLYGLGPLPSKSYVAIWNGQPGDWSVIGGPARYLYAGD